MIIRMEIGKGGPACRRAIQKVAIRQERLTVHRGWADVRPWQLRHSPAAVKPPYIQCLAAAISPYLPVPSAPHRPFIPACTLVITTSVQNKLMKHQWRFQLRKEAAASPHGNVMKTTT